MGRTQISFRFLVVFFGKMDFLQSLTCLCVFRFWRYMFFSEFERVSFGFAPNTHRIHWTGIFTYVYFPSKSTIHGSVNIPFVPWILWDMKSPKLTSPWWPIGPILKVWAWRLWCFPLCLDAPELGVSKNTRFLIPFGVCVCVDTSKRLFGLLGLVCLVCWFGWFLFFFPYVLGGGT